MYKENFGNIPNKDKIVSYLEEGYKNNPGKWVLHLWIIGKTAQNMAEELGLDPDIAFACGALHDIGKSTGAKNAEHFYEGYKILRSDSYFFPARIALTHSFQIKNVDAYVGEWNIAADKKSFVADFLKYNEYTEYDLLIQYLDGIIKTEYLGIEKRAEKTAKKHGTNPYFDQRKQRLYELEKYFTSRLAKPVEKYLPRPRWYKFPYNLFRESGN
ncbi:HDIG domain-containing metalloprotein [Anaerococcus cruorum]|uniref:HDIG domain-containing metalloprotein n=1 Tax=Anaerococcus sp. WGS1596 TaxID=3366806 RepID=UPI00372D3A59